MAVAVVATGPVRAALGRMTTVMVSPTRLIGVSAPTWPQEAGIGGSSSRSAGSSHSA